MVVHETIYNNRQTKNHNLKKEITPFWSFGITYPVHPRFTLSLASEKLRTVLNQLFFAFFRSVVDFPPLNDNFCTVIFKCRRQSRVPSKLFWTASMPSPCPWG